MPEPSRLHLFLLERRLTPARGPAPGLDATEGCRYLRRGSFQISRLRSDCCYCCPFGQPSLLDWAGSQGSRAWGTQLTVAVGH